MKSDILYYLASAYSHTDPKVRQERSDAVSLLALELTEQGLSVYAPISETVSLADAAEKHRGAPLSTSWAFWRQKDLSLLDRCDALIIAGDIEGWSKSVGVRAEVKYAVLKNKPVFLLQKGPVFKEPLFLVMDPLSIESIRTIFQVKTVEELEVI